MCKPWSADSWKQGHKGTHVGLGGPALRKFRAQLLGRRGGCRGLSLAWRLAPLGQLGTLTLPLGSSTPYLAHPTQTWVPFVVFASCVRVWPWETLAVPSGLPQPP